MTLAVGQRWARADDTTHIVEIRSHPDLNYVTVYDHHRHTERLVMRAHFGTRYQPVNRPDEETTP